MAPGEKQQPTGFPWNGTIIPWSAALRSKPTTRSSVLSDLPRGESVKVLLRAKGFLYVESKSKLKGFVSRELIAPAPTPNTVKGSTQTDAKAGGAPPRAGASPVAGTKSPAVPSGGFQLDQPRVIAVATDTYLTPMFQVTDDKIPGGYTLDFGQDLSFAKGRAIAHGVSVGKSVSDLEPLMRELLSEFAAGDKNGKARRLFDAFLKPQKGLVFWSDTGLNAAAESHPYITSFVHRALSAPNSLERTTGQVRIHQALEKAGWNINAAATVTGMGVPAFNRGVPFPRTDDFRNGLKVMINGIQHGLVIAKEYHYDPSQGEYTITLEYVFYDVFGLDDDDVREFGADGGYDPDERKGFSAWWQLQHQFGYIPLITRIAFERTFTVPVSPVASPRSPRP